MKKGFSLAEILVALVIISVLIIVMIPLITQAGDKQYKTLYKSAFKTAETVVSELVDDLNLYITGNFYNASASYFCNNFVSKVNTIGTVDCSTSTVPGTPNFTTTNGMRWYGLNNTFATSPALIHVDVDGVSKSNNVDGTDILEIYIYDQGKLSAPAGNETNYLTN